jgi:hypothetical protein
MFEAGISCDESNQGTGSTGRFGTSMADWAVDGSRLEEQSDHRFAECNLAILATAALRQLVRLTMLVGR